MSYYFITPLEAKKQQFLNLFRKKKVVIKPNPPLEFVADQTDEEILWQKIAWEAYYHGRTWLKVAV